MRSAAEIASERCTDRSDQGLTTGCPISGEHRTVRLAATGVRCLLGESTRTVACRRPRLDRLRRMLRPLLTTTDGVRTCRMARDSPLILDQHRGRSPRRDPQVAAVRGPGEPHRATKAVEYRWQHISRSKRRLAKRRLREHRNPTPPSKPSSTPSRGPRSRFAKP